MLEAQQFHASLLKTGFESHIYRCNLLIKAYVNSGFLYDARKILNLIPFSNTVSYNTLLSGYINYGRIDEALNLFSEMPETDTTSWNAVILGCMKCQRQEEALSIFVNMRFSSIFPDNFTYALLVPCCDLNMGQQLHGHIIKLCSKFDIVLNTNLIRMYMEAGKVASAQKVFDEMNERDLMSWNTLLCGYSRNGMGKTTLRLFKTVFENGTALDAHTFAIVLNDISDNHQVLEAAEMHSLLIKSGFSFDPFVNTSLVDIYSKYGFFKSAGNVFAEISKQDVVTWTAMIVGLIQYGYDNYATQLFNQMQLSGIKPNSYTFSGMLSGFSCSNSIQDGRRLQGLILKLGFQTNVVVGTALVNMYSRCGELNDALRYFQGISNKDLALWNEMICALAQNGEALQALELFNEMIITVLPNEVTFTGVLNACSHAGFLQEGHRYFHDMVDKYAIEPRNEHFTCMIDMLGRKGLLEEAETLILSLPFEPDNIMWSTLLAACKRHGNLAMAKRVAEKLFMHESENSSSCYVLLANSYTAIGEWDLALNVRESMLKGGVHKTAGCSWIRILDNVHSFGSGNMNHPQMEMLCELLQRLHLQTEGISYM